MTDSPHNRFRHVSELLEEASWSLDHKEPFSESISFEHEQAWQAEDLQYQDILDAICKRFAAERGPFPDLPPRQEYFLWCRFFAAIEFLHQCDMPEGKAMLLYPKASDQEMIEWILVEWWKHRGRDSALFSYVFPFQK